MTELSPDKDASMETDKRNPFRRGNLVAYELAEQCAEASSNGDIDPWPAFEQVMRAPHTATGTARNSSAKASLTPGSR